MAKRYLVRTFGCQMNEHDSERIAGLLESEGMTPADGLDDADVVVLNTCCIRENADNKLYGTLGHLKSVKEQRPSLEIMVGGCLAQKDQAAIVERAPHVDVVFGTHNVGHAAALLDEARRTGRSVVEILTPDDVGGPDDFASALPARRDVPYAAWLTIQVGCDNSCAFCIVPSVRGPEISRSFGNILAEATALAADGVTEITLLGQNVNSYGRDLAVAARAELGRSPMGLTLSAQELAQRVGSKWVEDGRARALFADLLDAVASVNGIRRVRFTSPHPKDLGADTAAVMGSNRSVCEHLHLPLQSGSDAVLRAMRRGYTAERYLERLSVARAAVDDLAVSTDIIVGFPGETEADFEQTLEVAAAAEYDNAYTFVYSPRTGTLAAEMTESAVEHSVAVERIDRLRPVVERSSRRRNEARIGRVDEVVVEGPSKRDPAVTTGRTRQNKLVHFTATSPLRPGTYVNVEVTAAGLSSLQGTMLEVVAEPTHRRRIPVNVG